MDAALPAPAGLSLPIDRRHIVRLVLTGAAGIALADGVPLMRKMTADGATMTLGSLKRTVSALAVSYEVDAGEHGRTRCRDGRCHVPIGTASR
jgi:hypothetical protein